MSRTRVAVIGGGAAGFFGAIHAAAACDVVLFEKSPHVLRKVRISGGGRCNVTHDCPEPRRLVEHYPRGHRELLGPFHKFGPSDTIRWFEQQGVELKVESDGRMFPTTDDSRTIIEALQRVAQEAGVRVHTRCGIETIRVEKEGFALTSRNDSVGIFDLVLLATGGSPRSTSDGNALAAALGHTIEDPVPSLFTFKISHPLLVDLAGVSVEEVALSVPGTKPRLTSQGPLLFTHEGLSGPAVLRLSAWGARELAHRGHVFEVHITWLPQQTRENLREILEATRGAHGRRLPRNDQPFPTLPNRLWGRLCEMTDLAETPWSQVPGKALDRMADMLVRTHLPVHGRTANKEEFVTCGGVRLAEVDFRTMESRLAPGLHFAGEALDIDGITGGFNFQAAWTTGYLAGTAMAAGNNL